MFAVGESGRSALDGATVKGYPVTILSHIARVGR